MLTAGEVPVSIIRFVRDRSLARRRRIGALRRKNVDLRMVGGATMIKSKLWSVAVAAWVLLPYGTLAQDPQRMKNALNNVQQEMMACAAYFNIFAVCIAKGGDDQKTVDGLRELSSKFIDRGGDVGKSIGMTEDAVVSRDTVAQDDQFNLINKDCVNLSSLISRHQKRCLLIMDDFKAAVNEYMK